ncbi:MAG: hypothetical protein HND57_13965 [Planctomycetes bacterium]|nr:hypothetical protein [Planctomycetota bacterium]
MKSARTTRRRKIGIAIAAVVGVWLVCAAWLLGTAWYRVPRYEPGSAPTAVVSLIHGPTEYERVIETHRRPHVYTCEAASGAGAVTVFGAEHTQDPNDPQVDLIRSEWEALHPTVALIESDLGMMFPLFMDPVVTFGEPGFVHALAREDDVPTYTWEPADGVVLRRVLNDGFTLQQVALRWILGPYFSQVRHGRLADPDGFVRDTLDQRSRVFEIEGVIASMDDIEAAWQSAFPDGPDWREVSDEFGLPGFLGEMDLNRPRDEHLVSCLAALIAQGERVFVICGSSHAVKIEPAVRALCE